MHRDIIPLQTLFSEESMRIYTKTGDAGETQLFGGARVPKSHLRIEAIGAVDEAIAAIAVAETHGLHSEEKEMLDDVMNRLFALNAMLATPGDAPENIRAVTQEDVDRVEKWIDALSARQEPLRQFVLPGGTPLAAELHLARTVVRRAERRIVQLHAIEEQQESVMKYVNRLSDYLFVLAREANREHGGDVPVSFE